jgi:hypothetical protein
MTKRSGCNGYAMGTIIHMALTVLEEGKKLPKQLDIAARRNELEQILKRLNYTAADTINCQVYL